MAINIYNNVLLPIWYTDNEGNKISYEVTNDYYKIVYDKIMLKGIPDYFEKVNVITIGSTPLYEEILGSVITTSNFTVDYNLGIITFDSSYDGQVALIPTWKNRGSIFFPADRVYDVLHGEIIDQEFVGSTIQDYINQLQTYLYKNTYDSGTTYYQNNQVYYQGSTYICIDDNTGVGITNIDPHVEDNWRVLSAGFNYSDFSALTQYYPRDVVKYNNTIYQCILKPTIGTLPTNTTYFTQMISVQDIYDEYNNTLKPDILEATENANNCRYLGDYNGITTYKVNNIIKYQNFLYICKLESTGNLPTNTTYFDIASKGFNWRDEYNALTSYTLLDVVSYLGSSYVCILDSTGNLPTNTTYFDLLASKGEKGATLSPRGAYDPLETYVENDLVYYNLSNWQCLQTSTGVTPSEGANWTMFLTSVDLGISPTMFTSASDNDLIDSAINLAISTNGCRTVVIPPISPINGDMWLLSRPIKIPTNFTLILNNCYIKLVNGANDNIIRTQNVDDLSFAENINIIGIGKVTLDGNGVNQTVSETVYNRIGVLFFNVDGFNVSGFTVKNTHGWGMSFESGCCNGQIHHIEIDQDGQVINQDGIDLRDGCHHIDIDYITGTSDDDCIALTALGNNIMQVVNDGSKGMDIHDINISNIRMKSGYCNIIDLICHDGRKTYNINISDVCDMSDKFHTFSVYGAVINIGNYDFAEYALIRPSQDGELHNIKINNVSGRGMYLVKYGWCANDIHITNLTARDDYDYVFQKYCRQSLDFTIRDIYIDGVYANQEQVDSNGSALTYANWRGIIFNFLHGDVYNLNASNFKIGSCKNVIYINTSSTMTKYCYFNNFDIDKTSHQIYTVLNNTVKLKLERWNINDRNNIYLSDVNKTGQFYPTKDYPNSIIEIGYGMPKFLSVDVKTNTIYSIETATTYYVNDSTGLDSNDGLTSGTAFKTIQKAIDVLPKILNNVVTINVAAGTYNENISISGFNCGSGYIVINGAVSLADTHIVNSITAINNINYIQINGFKVIATGQVAVFAGRSFGLDINYCKIDTTDAVYAGINYSNSTGRILGCEISNRNFAIYSTMFAGIVSESNTGSSNTYGLIADNGAKIVKISTQPSGVTAEYTQYGGTIV